jgi:hypothetical protein
MNEPTDSQLFSSLGPTKDFPEDAKAAIAEGITRSLVQMNADAVREIIGLYFYCGPEWTMNFIDMVVPLKYHQTPGITGKLIDALKALAMHDYFNKQSSSGLLGGGGGGK